MYRNPYKYLFCFNALAQSGLKGKLEKCHKQRTGNIRH